MGNQIPRTFLRAYWQAVCGRRIFLHASLSRWRGVPARGHQRGILGESQRKYRAVFLLALQVRSTGAGGDRASSDGRCREFLRRLIAEKTDASANARYILALMLERRKILRPVESRHPGLLVYEHVESGETFILPDPGLSLESLPAIQGEVYAMLALPLEKA